MLISRNIKYFLRNKIFGFSSINIIKTPLSKRELLMQDLMKKEYLKNLKLPDELELILENEYTDNDTIKCNK